MGEKGQPPFDGVDSQGLAAMLIGIDVAMATAEIASGQDMKKNIPCVFTKGYRFLHEQLVTPFLKLSSSKVFGEPY